MSEWLLMDDAQKEDYNNNFSQYAYQCLQQEGYNTDAYIIDNAGKITGKIAAIFNSAGFIEGYLDIVDYD